MASLAVDGVMQPQITICYAMMDACQTELAKARETVEAQHGRGTLDADWEKQ
jgi:hypothetical protein